MNKQNKIQEVWQQQAKQNFENHYETEMEELWNWGKNLLLGLFLEILVRWFRLSNPGSLNNHSRRKEKKHSNNSKVLWMKLIIERESYTETPITFWMGRSKTKDYLLLENSVDKQNYVKQ